MPNTQKIYLIAGEASGDLHGADLMKNMLQLNPNVQFRYWGGDKMAAVDGKPVVHYKDRNYMGFTEVLLNLRKLTKWMNQCVQDIIDWQPDKVVMIDNPGFNLRIAKKLFGTQIPIHYYIAPKAWAWNPSRAKKIKKYVSHLYSILPFELDFFKSYGIEPIFVGNPLVDQKAQFNVDSATPITRSNKPLIALLPGSRAGEVTRILPTLLAAAKQMPNCDFVLGKASVLGADVYGEFDLEGVQVLTDDTYSILSQADFAWVASGTATLETALFKVPQIVCYRTTNFNYQIAKKLIRIPYISLVNLIYGGSCVPELIQNDLNREALVKQTEHLLLPEQRNKTLEAYEKIETLCGEVGTAQRTAKHILS